MAEYAVEVDEPTQALLSDTHAARSDVAEPSRPHERAWASSWLPLLPPPPLPAQRGASLTEQAQESRPTALSLLHVVPIAIVQVSDYATDLLCLFLFYQSSGTKTFFYVGVGCILIAMLFALAVGATGGLQVTGMGRMQLTDIRERVVYTLLLPFNLHLLYAGILYADAAAKLPPKPTAEEAVAVRSRYILFITAKMAETGLEAIPLSLLTLTTLVQGGVDQPMVLASSLIISLLSMAYGYASELAETAEARHGRLPQGARAQLFVCTLVHLAWVLSSVGSFLAIESLGALRWLAPIAMLCVHVATALAIVLSPSNRTMPRGTKVFATIYMVVLAPMIAPMDFIPFNAPFEHTTPHDTSRTVRALPFIRRLVLYTLAVVACFLEFRPWQAPSLALLFLADVLCSIRLFNITGVVPDPRSMPKLMLVRRGMAHGRHCVFQHADKLREGATDVPLTLSSHPGRAIVYMSNLPWQSAEWSSLPLAVGPAADAVVISRSDNLLTTSDRRYSLGAYRSAYADGEAVRLMGEARNMHLQTGPSSRAFNVNADGTLSPCAAPHLVVGMAFYPAEELEQLAPEPPPSVTLKIDPGQPRKASVRRTSFFGNILDTGAQALHRLPPSHHALFDGLEELDLQLTERIEVRKAKPARKISHVHEEALFEQASATHPSRAEALGSRGSREEEDDEEQRPLDAVMVVLACQALQQRVRELIDQQMLGLSAAQAKHLFEALCTYVPVDDEDGPENALLEKLTIKPADEVPPTEVGGEAPTHPMRAVGLAQALAPAVWRTGRTVFGSLFGGQALNFYSESADSEKAEVFVSHNWGDDGASKLSKLRFFLCVAPLLGALSIACGLIAVFLLPASIAFHAFTPGMPAWALSSLPLAVLLGALVWLAIGYAGVLPTRLAPWAFAWTTLWVDRFCVDQQNVAGFIATGIGTYLLRCDQMIAFVSPTYFTCAAASRMRSIVPHAVHALTLAARVALWRRRLWCVYELATFCRHHQAHLDERLTLLSLSWPHMASPLKTPDLDETELAWMRGFRCRDARCFKASDRAQVMQAIRDAWGSEEAFDLFVRTELPTVLAAGKRKYQGLIAREAAQMFDFMFGD